jgi:hypothetical protein
MVFVHAQGIRRQRFEMTGGIGAERPKAPRIRKNSLLISLFSGNLRITADPYHRKPDRSLGFEFWKRCTGSAQVAGLDAKGSSPRGAN